MSQNIVETEYQSSLTIRGTCHQDFQNVAEKFAINFDKYKISDAYKLLYNFLFIFVRC